MKGYSTYKYSGIDWIGEIPSHWDISKIMYLSELVTDGSHFSPELKDNGKIYVTVTNVTKDNRIDFQSCSKISEESFVNLVKNGCQPKTGDILLTKDGTIGRGLVVGEFNDFVILSSLGLIRFNREINPHFGLYYLLSGLNIDQMYSNVRGSGITRLTISLIKNLLIIIPPLPEQRKIVSFLDEKTFKVDQLIQSKQRKIELLTEKRTSLINKVVTKGLNPDVEMKDSGVEWIGEIPSHWDTPKLKYLVKIGNGKSFSDIEVEKGGYPVLGTGGEFSRCSDYLYQGPSVLIGRKGTIDKPQITFEPFWTSDTLYYTIIGDDVLPRILYHLVCQIPFGLYSYGSTIPSMTKTDYEEMKFPIPPLKEQKSVLDFIDSETQIIDQTISLEERKIDLLKEYKQSLISEVVTGKVNVQEEVDEVLV